MTSPPGRDDTADVMAQKAGNSDAFEGELGPLVPEAVRLATGMLLNAVEAEDAVQDACVQARAVESTGDPVVRGCAAWLGVRRGGRAWVTSDGGAT